MAAHEPVTSPDQRKPGHPRAARLGAVLVAAMLVALVFGSDQEDNISTIWVTAGAGLLLVVMILDWVLRHHGLR
ncbi:hypothetical protein ACQP2P_29725 [Dactylosporangium sp. CA-139114]|uniref:hypothetical protein n=1 Tax=Dactylosporangium sp. CA-139114 TaxID=3239931 RepID=UPI003D97825B